MKNFPLFAAYVAYFIPLSVSLAALCTTDVPTPHPVGSLADAVFRQQLLAITIIVVATLHLVFGVTALRSKLRTDRADTSKQNLLNGTAAKSLVDAYLERSSVGLLADFLIFAALIIAIVAAAMVPTATPATSVGCTALTGTAIAYCGGIGFEAKYVTCTDVQPLLPLTPPQPRCSRSCDWG